VKLSDLAGRLDCVLEGDGQIEIVRVAGIQDAGPGDVTFIANPKYEKLLATTRASAVILKRGAALPNNSLVHRGFSEGGSAVLRADDPYLAFARGGPRVCA
jgi:UDP-3-O-[3-hydroxymyristoyl] glucosamine N-acyltransferase